MYSKKAKYVRELRELNVEFNTKMLHQNHFQSVDCDSTLNTSILENNARQYDSSLFIDLKGKNASKFDPVPNTWDSPSSKQIVGDDEITLADTEATSGCIEKREMMVSTNDEIPIEKDVDNSSNMIDSEIINNLPVIFESDKENQHVVHSKTKLRLGTVSRRKMSRKTFRKIKQNKGFLSKKGHLKEIIKEPKPFKAKNVRNGGSKSHILVTNRPKDIVKIIELESLTPDSEKMLSGVFSKKNQKRNSSLPNNVQAGDRNSVNEVSSTCSDVDSPEELISLHCSANKGYTPAQNLLFTTGKFFQIVEQNNGSQNIAAQCLLCVVPKTVRGSLNSLSNFTLHLKVCVQLDVFNLFNKFNNKN